MNRIYLNNDWKFAFDCENPNYEEVRIPHSVVETPFNYFSEESYQTVSEYRRNIFADESWRGNKLLLTFDGVAHYAEVFLGGEKIGEHFGGYTAFTLDISERLVFGAENELVVRVDSRESLNIPPFGNVIDYMTYGGIYRDVYLDVKYTTHISDVFVKAKANGEIDSDVEISGIIHKTMKVKQSIIIDGVTYLLGGWDADEKMSLSSFVEGVLPWSVDSPNLYTLKTELYHGKYLIDEHKVRIGFRDAEFRKDGFYLNGKKLKLRGLNRHQSYPYVGYAVPEKLQREDARILKEELGFSGLVITDAMNMGAITKVYSSADATVAALRAGCHIVLMPESLPEAFDAVLSALEDGTLTADWLDTAVRQILEFKQLHGILNC